MLLGATRRQASRLAPRREHYRGNLSYRGNFSLAWRNLCPCRKKFPRSSRPQGLPETFAINARPRHGRPGRRPHRSRVPRHPPLMALAYDRPVATTIRHPRRRGPAAADAHGPRQPTAEGESHAANRKRTPGRDPDTRGSASAHRRRREPCGANRKRRHPKVLGQRHAEGEGNNRAIRTASAARWQAGGRQRHRRGLSLSCIEAGSRGISRRPSEGVPAGISCDSSHPTAFDFALDLRTLTLNLMSP